MANSKHIEILKQGTEVWNRWRKEHPEVRPDLSNAHITVITHTSIYFDNGVMSGQSIIEPKLGGIDFRGADLNEADFSELELMKVLSELRTQKRIREQRILRCCCLSLGGCLYRFLQGCKPIKKSSSPL
jgi:hypothetical protein